MVQCLRSRIREARERCLRVRVCSARCRRRRRDGRLRAGAAAAAGVPCVLPPAVCPVRHLARSDQPDSTCPARTGRAFFAPPAPHPPAPRLVWINGWAVGARVGRSAHPPPLRVDSGGAEEDAGECQPGFRRSENFSWEHASVIDQGRCTSLAGRRGRYRARCSTFFARATSAQRTCPYSKSIRGGRRG